MTPDEIMKSFVKQDYFNLDIRPTLVVEDKEIKKAVDYCLTLCSTAPNNRSMPKADECRDFIVDLIMSKGEGIEKAKDIVSRSLL